MARNVYNNDRKFNGTQIPNQSVTQQGVVAISVEPLFLREKRKYCSVVFKILSSNVGKTSSGVGDVVNISELFKCTLQL